MFHLPPNNVFLIIDTVVAFGLLALILISATRFLKSFIYYNKLVKEFDVIQENLNISTTKSGIEKMREIRSVSNCSESKKLIEEAEVVSAVYVKRLRAYSVTAVVTFFFVVYLFSKNYM